MFKWSSHGHVMPFSAVQPKRFNAPNQKIDIMRIPIGHIRKYFALYIILQLF